MIHLAELKIGWRSTVSVPNTIMSFYAVANIAAFGGSRTEFVVKLPNIRAEKLPTQLENLFLLSNGQISLPNNEQSNGELPIPEKSQVGRSSCAATCDSQSIRASMEIALAALVDSQSESQPQPADSHRKVVSDLFTLMVRSTLPAIGERLLVLAAEQVSLVSGQ